jgi:hypothetical protein
MLRGGGQTLEDAFGPVATPCSQVAPGWRSRRLTIPWVSAAALLASLIALLPLFFVASATIETGWTEVAALIWRPRVGELLINTALLTIIATPLCVVLGIGLAILTERTDLPGHRLWSMTAAAPLAIPAFMHSYAWVSVAPSLHGPFARRVGFRACLFSVSLSAGRRLPARTRSGARRCHGLARARAPSRLLSNRAAATPAGDLGRRPFARPAFAVGIRALRDGSLRYVHHRDSRSVSIDLQRTRRQYTSGDVGAALPRASPV